MAISLIRYAKGVQILGVLIKGKGHLVSASPLQFFLEAKETKGPLRRGMEQQPSAYD